MLCRVIFVRLAVVMNRVGSMNSAYGGFFATAAALRCLYVRACASATHALPPFLYLCYAPTTRTLPRMRAHTTAHRTARCARHTLRARACARRTATRTPRTHHHRTPPRTRALSRRFATARTLACTPHTYARLPPAYHATQRPTARAYCTRARSCLRAATALHTRAPCAALQCGLSFALRAHTARTPRCTCRAAALCALHAPRHRRAHARGGRIPSASILFWFMFGWFVVTLHSFGTLRGWMEWRRRTYWQTWFLYSNLATDRRKDHTDMHVLLSFKNARHSTACSCLLAYLRDSTVRSWLEANALPGVPIHSRTVK